MIKEKISILSSIKTDEIFNFEHNLLKLEFSDSKKYIEYDRVLNDYKNQKIPIESKENHTEYIERRLSRLSLLEGQ